MKMEGIPFCEMAVESGSSSARAALPWVFIDEGTPASLNFRPRSTGQEVDNRTAQAGNKSSRYFQQTIVTGPARGLPSTWEWDRYFAEVPPTE